MIKGWTKIIKNKRAYDFHPGWKHVWINNATGNFFVIIKDPYWNSLKHPTRYYLEYTGKRSILIATRHHPQDPYQEYKEALADAEKFMREYPNG